MRVEVEREAATKMVNVWVVEDGWGDSRGRVWTPIGDGPEWTEVAAGASAPVSLRLPEEVWVAMIAAGADVPMPSRAQADHLADARMVRDRLLDAVFPPS
jgi:hypothetical protein